MIGCFRQPPNSAEVAPTIKHVRATESTDGLLSASLVFPNQLRGICRSHHYLYLPQHVPLSLLRYRLGIGSDLGRRVYLGSFAAFVIVPVRPSVCPSGQRSCERQSGGRSRDIYIVRLAIKADTPRTLLRTDECFLRESDLFPNFQCQAHTGLGELRWG